jgi:hypothetical protein
MRDWGEPSRRVDLPEPGFFELTLVRSGPLVAAKITFADGLWGAWIDGVPCGDMNADPALADGVFRIWHGARRISESDYNYRLSVKSWALKHDNTHPAANPRQSIDLDARPSIF